MHKVANPLSKYDDDGFGVFHWGFFAVAMMPDKYAIDLELDIYFNSLGAISNINGD